MVSEADKLLIERHRAADLEPAAAAELRRRLTTEADLRAYAERSAELDDFLATEARVAATMTYLQNLETPPVPDAAPTPEAAARRPPRTVPWAVAGLVVLGMLLALWLIFRPRAAAPLIEHRPLAVAMADAPPAAVRAYNQGDYAAALPGLLAALAAEPDPALRLAVAICYLETERPAEALSELERLSDAPLHQDARAFYQGLAHYRDGNPAAARTALKQVPPGGFYGTAADRLRAAMKAD